MCRKCAPARPSLVRSGLLGDVDHVGGREFVARWTDGTDAQHEATLPTYARAVSDAVSDAVSEVARRQAGLRFHDLRHSYATWLVDDGVPPNMVQRVPGHEKVTTTLDLYTRRTDNSERILRALDDPGEEDPPPTLVPG